MSDLMCKCGDPASRHEPPGIGPCYWSPDCLCMAFEPFEPPLSMRLRDETAAARPARSRVTFGNVPAGQVLR